MDPSTTPHIRELDILVTCRLKFSYFYFPFLQYALLKVVPSKLFEPCNLPDQPTLRMMIPKYLQQLASGIFRSSRESFSGSLIRAVVKLRALLIFGFIFISFLSTQSSKLSRSLSNFSTSLYLILSYKLYNHLQII